MASWKSIVAFAVMLFASAMMGLAIHYVLGGGTCSSTGFTRYGPAPVCASSSTAWGIVLPAALPVIILAAALAGGSIFVMLGPLFLAIGVGALTVGTDPDLPSGFASIFGGCFAVAGAGLLARGAWSARRAKPSGRLLIALPIWVAAPALAFAVGTVFPKEHSRRQRAKAVDTAFFQPASLSPTDPSSLYEKDSFARALAVARFYIGAHGPVRSVDLVPGGVDLSVVVDPAGPSGKDISIDNTGGYLSSDVVTLKSLPASFPLSALRADIPSRLTAQLPRSVTVDHLAARPDARGVAWFVYLKGGQVYRAGGDGSGELNRVPGG